MWQKLSGYFLRGLITLLPLLITIWMLWFLFTFLDGILGNIITLVLGHSIPGLGFVSTILLIFITGFFATFLVSAKVFKWGEQLLYHMPIVKTIYSAVKQVNDVLFLHKGSDGGFRRACLIEFPRKGAWSIGFITSDAAKEIEEKVKEKLINVFVANTPTPAAGFIIIVPAKDVILLDMKLDEALKYVISGGVLKPEDSQVNA